MSTIEFTVNGVARSVGSEIASDLLLVDYLRNTLELRGTKVMCREAGCGVCTVSVVKTTGAEVQSVNSCVVPVAACDGWAITTIEKVGNKLDGYHSIQKTLAKYNGSQCGFCSPGWVMAMYSLQENNTELTMLEMEKAFGGNICRCTGYRPILDAFKTYAKDSPTSSVDIEDLHICDGSAKGCCKQKSNCEDKDDWCMIAENVGSTTKELTLKDGVKWYTVTALADVLEILETEGTDSYMLAAGNTGKVPYPSTTTPSVIIDISRVTELRGYTVDQNLVIGAANTLNEISDILTTVQTQDGFSYLEHLIEHKGYLGHVTLRNIATLGGNLAMKNANVGFGSDLYLLLEMVGGTITVESLEYGTETVTPQEFVSLDMTRKVIVSVELPPLSDEYIMTSFKVMGRSQAVHAMLNCGICFKVTSENVVSSAVIVYGGLTTKSIRATETENYLVGKSLFTNETLQGAISLLDSELVVTANAPEPSAEFRKQLAINLFYKGLLKLCPTATLQSKYRSGADKLHDNRPVSEATQTYETDSTKYPLTEAVTKAEALIQCAGEAQYTDDIPRMPHEVHAAFVLSSVCSGEIVSIDPTEALALDGVLKFMSAKDIPGTNSYTPDDVVLYGGLEEVMCSGTVMYYEQPIGMIIAEDQLTADKAAKLVTATYKNVKDPVVNVKTAAADSTRNTLYLSGDATETGTDVSTTITGSHIGHGQYHTPTETMVSYVMPCEEGYRCYSSTQWTNGVQLMISRALNVDKNKVDVHIRRVGGSFGMKIAKATQGAVACALVTHALNRPCRMVQSLTTNMKAFGKRLPYYIEYEASANSAGEIQSMTMNMYEDNGYMVNEDFYGLSYDALNNIYKSTSWTYKCYNTLTDTHSNTWCRAPGTMEFIANTEIIMEHLSYELGLDPLTVRLANVDTTTHNDITELITTMKSTAEYETRRAEVETFNSSNRWRKRGLRVSTVRWTPVSAGGTGCSVTINQGDGTVTVMHGGVEMGQGINTKVMQVVAHLLGLTMDQVQVKETNTHIYTNQFVTGGSVASENVCAAAAAACEILLTRLAEVKATMTGDPTYLQIVKQCFDNCVDLSAHGYRSAANFVAYNVYVCCLAEVEIDVLTGEHEVLRVDLFEDVGTSVSPEIDIGQIEGAFLMGMGYWTCEQLVYNETSGQLLTTRLWNYFVPQARDIPQIMNIHFRTGSYSNDVTFGSKCVGEPPLCAAIAVAFAIQEAISSATVESGNAATSVFSIEAPFTVEKIGLGCGTQNTELLFN